MLEQINGKRVSTLTPTSRRKRLFFSQNKTSFHPPLNLVITLWSKHYWKKIWSNISTADWTFNMFNEVSKTLGLFGKLQNNKSRASLGTIYKSFMWPNLDYGDILYNRTFNSSFHERLRVDSVYLSTSHNTCCKR